MRALPLLFLLACGSDYDFVDVEPDGAAISSSEDASAQVRRDRFAIGGKSRTPLVDYLFVIDNSVSMNAVLGNVRQGIDALAAEPEAFGERARVAVITTLPADPSLPEALHPAVNAVDGLELDPGFGAPVTQQRMRDYKQVARGAKRRMPLGGCDAWFAPGEKHPKGHSCFAAHTQVGLTATGVEAGLVAFDQLLDREDFAFREGAAVNVVFISDTHDPGVPPTKSAAVRDLVSQRPDADTLRDRVLDEYGASAFYIHAIAPQTECTNEAWTAIGPVYFDAAEATGGAQIDICTATDYRPLLAEMADTGAIATRPVLSLGREPAEILEVRLDGVPVEYAVDGKRVELAEMPTASSQVEVIYKRR